jgi:uncharacterized membrane protein
MGIGEQFELERTGRIEPENKRPTVVMSDFQNKCVQALRKNKGAMTLAEIAAAVKSSKTAVSRAMWLLRAKGLSDYHRGHNPDRWSVQRWFLTAPQ